jgi:hypothetical protein
VLCENCHRDEHLEHPDQTSLGLYLKLASSLIGERPYVSVTDLADDIKRRCVKLKIPVNVERINGAIAVVCGNRLTSPAQVEREQKYAHVPKDQRPISDAEAHEIIGLMGIEAIAATLAKTMPSHQARDPRTHLLMVQDQVAEFHASRRLTIRPKRVPMQERLKAIFAEQWE